MAEHDKVLDICEEKFISRKSVWNSFWIVIPIVLVLMGSAVAWAITQTSDVSSLKSTTAEMSHRLDKLDSEINKKLDILIERSDVKLVRHRP